MIWHFFVVACMANAPTDCETLILDMPRARAGIEAGQQPTPAFRSRDACLAQVDRITWFLPFRVMGSQWVQYGCIRK